MKPVYTLLLALLLAAMVAACGRGPSGAPAPLAYAPADTAYVFGNLEPTPDAVVELWRDLLAPLDSAFRQTLAELRQARGSAAADGDEDQARLWAILELFEDKLSIDGWENIGIHPDALWAMYGIELMPVLRLEVAQPERLRAFIAELEQRYGQPFPVASLRDQDYWRFTLPGKDPAGAIVMAIIDRHLVLTADLAGADLASDGPAGANPTDDDTGLARLLGLDAPVQSVLDSGELVAVNKQYAFTPYGTAVLDLRRTVAQLLGSQDRETWFSTLLASKDAPLSAQCRSEYQALVEKTPRMVTGYTRLDRQRQDSVGILEMDPHLRQSMAGLAATVPGLGQSRTGMELGIGLNLERLAGFLQAQASAIKQDPFACEHLQGLNTAADSTTTATAGLYGASGLRIHLRQLTLGATGAPDQVEGTVILASPSPAALIGMAQGFVPQLAQLELTPGGEPVPLDMEGIPGGETLPQAWAALGEGALGVAIGEDSRQTLLTDLSADSQEPAPLSYMGYEGAFYAGLMRQMRAMEQGGLAGGEADAAAAGKAMSKNEFEAIMAPVLAALDEIYTGFSHVSMDLVVTERGLEVRQKMSVN